MAERRMFSRSIINSARFLRMPQTSRLLYYDLGMAADDDGIVEAFTVIRTTGAAEDDLRVLASRGFILVLNEDLVSYIRDWNVNNQLRKDRYKPSIYAELLVKITDGSLMATGGLPDGNQTEPQDSLVKVSTVEKSIVEKPDKPPAHSRFMKPTLEEIKTYCQARQNNIDPERFMNYYEANGWMVGRNPMKDWKAAIRTWEQRKEENHGSIGKRIATNRAGNDRDWTAGFHTPDT